MIHKRIHKRSKRSSKKRSSRSRISKRRHRLRTKKHTRHTRKNMHMRRTRKRKMRGGADSVSANSAAVGDGGANIPTSSANIVVPAGGPVSGNSPQSNAAQVNGANNAQNVQVHKLAGGRRLRSKKNKNKKQRGGMGPAAMCTGPIINSADGYGYLPPIGCIQVPVLQNADAQNLAISSVHISATGQANAQYDIK